MVLQAILMYTPMAPVFKITPLGLADIAALLGGGLLFGLTALLYQAVKRKAEEG